MMITPLERDVSVAQRLGARSLAHENRDGDREIPMEELDWHPLPRGLARQHEWAHQLLNHFDGDIERLFATAQACRLRVGDSRLSTDARVHCVRATDLCERAIALVTARSGPNAAQRELMGRYMADAAEVSSNVRYQVVWTHSLPLPRLSDRACMGPLTTGQRWSRQLRPDRTARDCCETHRGDWHRASRAAIGVVSATRRAGLPDAAVVEVLDHVSEEKRWPASLRSAVHCLVAPGFGIEMSGSGAGVQYHDGRHRAHAMITAGVRRTVIIQGES